MYGVFIVIYVILLSRFLRIETFGVRIFYRLLFVFEYFKFCFFFTVYIFVRLGVGFDFDIIFVFVFCVIMFGELI